MTQFKQSEISVRFLEVFEELIRLNLVVNMKQFCNRLTYLPQSMSQIRTGKRDVTIDLIVKIYHAFRGNPVYILLGYESKILKSGVLPTVPEDVIDVASNNDASKIIKKLEELVESKNENIDLLKKEVERLGIELERRVREI